MATEIERYIPPRFNRAILYTILIPEIIRSNKYDIESYIKAVTKFEMDCEKRLKGLLKQMVSTIQSDHNDFLAAYLDSAILFENEVKKQAISEKESAREEEEAARQQSTQR